MKNFKKIGAFVLVVVMMLALTATAFAEETMADTGVVGEKTSTLNATLRIPKTLNVFNPDEASVYAPNISYSYAVTAGTAGIEITDEDEVAAKTRTPSAAQMPALAADTLRWSSASTTLDAAETGAENTQYLELTFTPAAFTAAGVYRFVITETVTYDGTGVIAGENTDHELFLDVYVRDTGTTPGGTIYGYVLHTGDDSIDGKTPTNVNTKTEGFVYDEYHTSNLTVGKTLVGDAAMNGHRFPMAVTIAAGDVTEGFHLLTKATGTATVAATLADKTYTDAAEVANGGTVKYIGLPTGATFTVTETNDVVGTTYKVTHSIDGTATEDGNKYTNETATAAVTTVAADKAHTVQFTNELQIISPTGVVLRVAPYVMILTAGIALLLVSKRSRRDEA